MVLLYGLPEDTPIMKVYEQLLNMQAEVVFLNQRLLEDYAIELSIGEKMEGQVKYKDHLLVNLKDVTGLYIRPYDYTQTDEFEKYTMEDEAMIKAGYFEYLLTLWADVFTGKIINKPAAMQSNHSKPYQGELIKKAGLAVPETLITTDTAALQHFWKKHGKVIYKSISSQRSIVEQLTASGEEDIEDIKNCVTQFQQYVDGTDYRVHVLGDKIFPAKINSESSDYRYAGDTVIEAVELPVSITEKCIAVTRQLGLNFSGIDLRCSVANEWFCFEVNPSPGYTYFENYTGQPIAKEVAMYLNS